MEQIKGLAGLLGQSDTNEQRAQPDPIKENSIGDSLNTEMIGTVMKLAPLLQSARSDDDSIRLLRALKPFMHDERAKKN